MFSKNQIEIANELHRNFLDQDIESLIASFNSIPEIDQEAVIQMLEAPEDLDLYISNFDLDTIDSVLTILYQYNLIV